MGDLKNRKHYNTTIPIWQTETIKELSIRTRINQSLLAEEAYNDLFIKYGIDIDKEKESTD